MIYIGHHRVMVYIYIVVLVVVSFYKYLGLYFTPKLVWSKTKDMLSKQALKAISNIYRYQRNFGRFNPKDMFKLFDTMVKPILCYGSEIWGFTYSEVIEKKHTYGFVKDIVAYHLMLPTFLH